MCVGLSYLVKFTYLSSLKNINVDDVTEGLWTNDFVFVFIHRWFFELPIVITFLFTMIRTCKAMSTPETLKKLCLNLRCQRNALLLGKVSISLTSITPTHFRQFWESWLIQTLPLCCGSQSKMKGSQVMIIQCALCAHATPRNPASFWIFHWLCFLGYFVHRSWIPFYISLYRSDCRPGKNPNRTQKHLLLFYKGGNVNDCSQNMIFSSLFLS